jgi:hypothetical protein
MGENVLEKTTISVVVAGGMAAKETSKAAGRLVGSDSSH